MLLLLKQNKSILIFVFFLVAALAATGVGALVLIPLVCLYYGVKRNFLYLLICFMVLLPLADSIFGFSGSAYSLRPIVLIILFIFYLLGGRNFEKIDSSFYYFIPYFIVVAINLYFIPTEFVGIQKSISYMLVILIIPVFINYLVKTNMTLTLKSIILVYSLVFLVSIVLMQFQGGGKDGRLSGIFWNPNSMGIFSFLFIMLFTIIIEYYPNIMTRLGKYLIYGLIFSGVLLCKSRSALFAIILFFTARYIYARWKLTGILIIGVLIIVFLQFVDPIGIIKSVGLGKFLRVNSLESGSGREIAFEFAWERIKNSPIFGNGIGFTERFFEENKDELNQLGHVGGIHNSYLWIWLETGVFGIITFVLAWFLWFKKIAKFSYLAIPVGLAVLFSSNLETWLGGSLNHVMTQFLIILSLLTNKYFISRGALTS